MNKLVILLLLILNASCATTKKMDRLWWQKKPLDNERAYFDWALGGPQGPADGYVKPKDFVGWYGVLKECRQVKVQVPRAGETNKPLTQALLTLEHRYADQTNVYRGIGDHVSVQTISLFGDGEFFALTDSCGDPSKGGLWKGDLVRAYGDVRSRDDRGRWIVETVHVRSWPRDQYELAPLRASFSNGRIQRQAPASWPVLILDREVPSSELPIDKNIKADLIKKLANTETQDRAALALAEYGGSDAVAALSRVNLQGPKKKALERAKREIGPVWRPRAKDPYWSSEDNADPELYKMRNFTP